MIGKAIAVATSAIVLLTPLFASGQAGLARIHGRVMEDGRPIRRIVEIRLESRVRGVIDRVYTLSSEEFEFRGVPIDLSDQYVLAIDEQGFEPVREPIEMGRDPFGAGVYVAGGMVMLYLTSLPPEESPSGEPPAVDLRQLTATIPAEAREAYEEALNALDNGNADAALQLLARAVELAPDYYDALNQLGVVHLNLQRFSEAREALERAFELNRNDPLAATNLGTVYFQQAQAQEGAPAGDFEAAMASYRQAVDYLELAMRLNPGSARVAYYLGSALYKTGNYARAEEASFVALERDSQWDEARLTLINIYVRQQRHQEALAQIELYLEANPDTPEREAIERARDVIESALEQ